MAPTPASLGYSMPAEWERHRATWLSWPKNPDTFPAEILPLVEASYVKIVKALASDEEVRIMVDDPKTEARVRSLIDANANVTFRRLRTVDVWVRDYGPIYVRGKGVALTKWIFNAWGNKYVDLKPDNEAGDRMAKSEGLPIFSPGMVLEGGSVDVNGRGCMLTTEQCLLNENRNPSLGKGAIQSSLMENLGVDKVIWLEKGIEGDDTDGHVDDIARFVGPRAVIAAAEVSESDPNHGVLVENMRRLEEATDQDGHGLEIVGLLMPPRVESDWGRLPASHINFYIGNAVVLVPMFGGDSDRAAIEIVGRSFPEREIVGMDCRAIVHGLGTLHCVTQQVPQG